ncbi:MAG: diadenylate cyclase [Acutalibacteraceae bacterium]
MSRERVGVLLIFERETPLDEYFKTGTIVDAQLSEQLLRNLFFKNSPLHDGAVIVRGGRVAAAGCVMPLSDNPHLPSDLGTRHRAGVGTSEVSDAVVVIVSEENGTISVAIGGMLKRHLAPRRCSGCCPMSCSQTRPRRRRCSNGSPDASAGRTVPNEK